MKSSLFQLPFLLACVLLAGAAKAEKADRNKPMNIEADTLRYDDLKQTSVFTGRVVVTKGTMIIRGAQLDVRQDPDGNQFGVVKAEPGKLAFFRQKRDTDSGNAAITCATILQPLSSFPRIWKNIRRTVVVTGRSYFLANRTWPLNNG